MPNETSVTPCIPEEKKNGWIGWGFKDGYCLNI